MAKGLRKELLATLLRLKGFGAQSVLKIADGAEGIETPQELYEYTSTLKDKKSKELTLEQIVKAYEEVMRIVEKSENEGIGMLGYYDPQFPKALHNCVDENGKLAPPLLLYYRGNLEVLKRPGVAIIGTREPTPNGVKAGKYFSEYLAKQHFNIVSGLAIGCDTTAHEGALLGGGATTAFLAHGLDWEAIYPKENAELAKQIVSAGGLLLSEYSIEEKINRYQLVARDRLQAGLSNGTIVIQTGEKGGTMHAVNATLMAKKPLFAIEFTKKEELRHEKVQGNIMLLEEKKATPANSENIDNVIGLLRKQPIKAHKSKKRHTMKSIIFDLDLTLVDTSSLEELRSKRKWDEVYALISSTSLYDGIREVLDIIHKNDIKVAIVSTSPRPYIEKIVAYHNIPAQHIVGYHDAKFTKPHPAPMLKALELLACPPKAVVSFGDRVIDIQSSNAANIESVACLWGTKERKELLSSDYSHAIIKPSEILTLIR